MALSKYNNRELIMIAILLDEKEETEPHVPNLSSS